MNKAELRAACRRIAPDFRLEVKTLAKGERVWVATCIYGGQVLELTMAASHLFDVERAVLQSCLEDLRRRETTRAA